MSDLLDVGKDFLAFERTSSPSPPPANVTLEWQFEATTGEVESACAESNSSPDSKYASSGPRSKAYACALRRRSTPVSRV